MKFILTYKVHTEGRLQKVSQVILILQSIANCLVMCFLSHTQFKEGNLSTSHYQREGAQEPFCHNDSPLVVIFWHIHVMTVLSGKGTDIV